MAAPRICSVDGCDKPAKTRGWCNGHYRKWTRHGFPEGVKASHGEPLKFLLAAVSSDTDECIDWTFSRLWGRYGVMRYEGEDIAVHRLACSLAHGEPPTADSVAAHSCNRGPEGCINPRHLRWATQQENVQEYHEWRKRNAA